MLRDFYADEHLREAVRDFFIESLGELAKRRAFDGEDTNGIAEAKEAIDESFRKLKSQYGVKDKNQPRSSV